MRLESYAVLGDPIDHSLSPAMHTAAFAAADLPHRYQAIRVPAARLSEVVHDLRERRYAGFNVTIPHKETVGAFLDDIEPLARSVGAVNTVICRNGHLTGHNTDVPGFLSALEALHAPQTGERAVVLGTGGAARAVVHALSGRNMAITVVSRQPHRGIDLTSLGGSTRTVEVVGMHEALQAIAAANLLVNATPAGMPPLEDVLPTPRHLRLHAETVVVDLVYGRSTPLLRLARSSGCKCSDGLEMLVQQGAAAFRLWTGVTPNIDVMRNACRAALGKVQECSVF